ncbi:hypothetical protein CPT_Paso_016 [Rhizobium phage Paso]|uniref:Uncharacterized protein n=1 Tax=Rhizobium phage Paso TaxID=2767574 RepID=A0A7L8G4P0_9CAUD|nr:hypothetical protein CPT_Paso_016 [Rhizobium phage Paso]
MKTSGELIDLVRQCTYKPGWKLICGQDKGKRLYIQVEVTTEAEASMESTGPCKGIRSPWKGGKHYLSLHMCRQEVVSACFAAFLAAEEHESREWFRYKGASIFNPHLDPDVLAEIARKKSSFNVRENAMTMVET